MGTARRRGMSAGWGIALSGLFVAVVLGLLLALDAQSQVLRLLAWFDAQGLWGPVLFTLIMAMVVILLLPGVMFTTGAGFVFGLVQGVVCVVIGTTLGAVIAFLIARHLFGERARRYLPDHAGLRLVSEEMARQGWKIVMLTRLVPFFPFKASNYLFGLTPVSLRDFTGGTLLGIIPFSLHNVYLGAIAADLATLGERHMGRTPLEWALYAMGFLATIAGVVYLNRLARRALSRYEDIPTPGGPPS